MTKRILCIEDDPDSALLVEVVADVEGWDYTWAATGAAGLAAVKVACPDVILLDINLPDINGFELAGYLKTEGCERLPIIGWTANALIVDRQRIEAAGMADFLNKPVDVDELSQTLRAQLVVKGDAV